MLPLLDVVIAYVRARLGREERGASLVEYTLLVGLIALVCVVAVQFLGNSTGSMISKGGSSLR